VRIPVPAVDEREQQAITPDVSFHTMVQDMKQRMDSMATGIGTLNVELNNSRQASQYHSSWSSRSKAVKKKKKKKKQRKKSYNTTSDDDDDDDDDESTGSSTGTDATPMPIMDNSTLRTFYLADGSAMLPVATSDSRLTDQVDYRRYRLKKRKALLRSEEAKGLTRRAREIHKRMPSLYFDGSEQLAFLTFLRQLKIVFDEPGITEAMGSRFLFDFVRGKASRMLESSRASVDRTINSYPGLVQHLLKVYATESAMMRAKAAFYRMMQHPGEDVPLFASRLQEQSSLLGTLYTAEELKGKFVQGLAPGVGGFIAAVGPSHKDESFMTLVTQTTDLAQGVTCIAQHSTGKLSTFSSIPTSSPAPQIRVGRSRLLAITEPDEMSSSTSGESEDNDKYDVAMDAELDCMVVNGDRGQLPTRYCYICWNPTHISPDCPLISDEERKAIAKSREAALSDRSRVVRFRPSPSWLTIDKQPPLIRQGEKPHLRFGERHNVEMDQKN
jgi:hypothetical protein